MDPVAVVLPLLVALVAMVAWRMHYDFAAPSAVFGIVWSLAIVGAHLSPFDRPTWGVEMWLLATVPPGCLIVAASLTAGRAAVARPSLGSRRELGAGTSMLLILSMAILVGGAVLVAEFPDQIPLLSSQIDAVRFTPLANPYLHLLTRLVPVAGILAGLAAPRSRGLARIGYVALAGIAISLLAATGGRLEVVLVVATIVATTYLWGQVSSRAWVALAATTVLLVGFSSALFWLRASQHASNPFEQVLFGDLAPARPDFLAWTIPAQIGVSGGLYVMNALVERDALSLAFGDGLYTLHGLDSVLPAKDSQAVARGVTGALVAPTYLADIYGDFGLFGAALWSLLAGAAYGLAYRAAVIRRALPSVLLYAYAGFWLAFFIYVDIWTYYAYWPFDLLLLWAGAKLLESRSAPYGVSKSSRSSGLDFDPHPASRGRSVPGR